MKQANDNALTRALQRAGEEARLHDLSPERIAATRRLATEAILRAQRADGVQPAATWGWPAWAATAAAVLVAAFLVRGVHQALVPEEPVERVTVADIDVRELDSHVERQQAAIARDMARWRKQYFASQDGNFFNRRSGEIRSRIELCAAGIAQELGQRDPY